MKSFKFSSISTTLEKKKTHPRKKNLEKKQKGEVEPIFLEESIIVEVVFEVFEFLGGFGVDPGFVFGLVIRGRGERWGLESGWLFGQISELSLDIVPLSRGSFYVLVHEMVIAHSSIFSFNLNFDYRTIWVPRCLSFKSCPVKCLFKPFRINF